MCRPLRIRSFACSIIVLVLLASLPRTAAAQPAGYVFDPGNAWFSIVDTATRSLSGTVTGNINNEAIASRDGRRVYVASGASLRIIDVGRQLLVATIPTNSPPGGQALGLAITPDESAAWVANAGVQNVGVIDLSTHTLAATIPLPFAAYDVAITQDGQRAIVVGSSSSAAIIDVATRTVTQTMALTGTGYDVVIHPDGHTAYVALPFAEEISVVDLDAGVESTTVPLDADPTGLVLSPDGTTLYVSVQSSAGLRTISTATNTVLPAGTLNGVPSIYAFAYGLTLVPGSTKLYFAALNSVDTVAVIDIGGATPVFETDITTGPYPGTLGAGPPIIRDDCCADTVIDNDAELTALGIGDYVPFLHGTLRLTGHWVTNRSISLLSDGAARTDGIIDTNSASATVAGRVIGEGTLVKRGFGVLTLDGDALHTGGTRVEFGGLRVNAGHTGTVTLTSPNAALSGTGPIGAIQAAAGTVSLLGPMTAQQVTLAPGARLQLNILSSDPATFPRLNVTGTAHVDDAILVIADHASILWEPGARTLVTNATGRFRDMPDNWTTSHLGTVVRLSYRGGSGSDIVLYTETAPTLAAIGDRTIMQDGALGPITLAFGDDFTAPGVMTIAATSSNQALVPNAQLMIGNAAGVRTLTATPLVGASGQTTITVTVTDEAGLQAQQSFVLTVEPTRSYYLAEGATGGFFSTDLLIANPNATAAPVTIRFSKSDGTTVTLPMTLAAMSRTTVRANDVEGLDAAAFSTTVVSTSGLPLVVERTMWWDASGYGASTEKAGTEGATTWYFAEGAQGYFHTYFLLFNPNITPTVAHVTYLMEGGESIQQDYPVPAGTRVTVDAAELPDLMHRSFGARIVFDQPALAERAMYFGETPLYTGGAAAAGVTAPAASWYLAEGATGSFFDTFVLIANPNDAPANLTLTFLPDTGQPIERSRTLDPHQRLTINLAEQDAALANAAVSTRVESDQPVVVERSQYWPHGSWYESHASAGQTTTGLTWGLAEGRVGGASEARTFILIANPGANAAAITATFLRTDGTPVVKEFAVPATSRFTIAIDGDPNGHAPELTNESFATIVSSTEPVIVERALYTSTGGTMWAAGTSSTGTRLVP